MEVLRNTVTMTKSKQNNSATIMIFIDLKEKEDKVCFEQMDGQGVNYMTSLLGT
jgi:hypothetical protein